MSNKSANRVKNRIVITLVRREEETPVPIGITPRTQHRRGCKIRSFQGDVVIPVVERIEWIATGSQAGADDVKVIHWRLRIVGHYFDDATNQPGMAGLIADFETL